MALQPAGGFGVAASRWGDKQTAFRCGSLLGARIFLPLFLSVFSSFASLRLFWIEECPFSFSSSFASAAYPPPPSNHAWMRCSGCINTPFPFLRCCYTSLNASPNRARRWISYNSIPQWPSHCHQAVHWPVSLILWDFKPWPSSIFQLGHGK